MLATSTFNTLAIRSSETPFLSGFQDHRVLLNRGHSVHTLVVRVGLIVGRNQAAGVSLAELP